MTGCVKDMNSRLPSTRLYPDTIQISGITHDPYSNEFPNFLAELESKECVVFNPEGRPVPMKDFFAESGKGYWGRKHVKNKLMELQELDSPDLSPVELAVKGVELLWKDLSVTDGKGSFTDKHEAEIPELGKNDSTQTLDDFLMHESGKYEGDCEDFSRALVEEYELMKEMAKEGKDEFHSKLYQGLRRYVVIGLDVAGHGEMHAMNASLLYSEDFSEMEVKIIEPQYFDYEKDGSIALEDLLFIQDGTAIVSRTYKDKKILNFLVWRVYNSHVCYEMPKDLRQFLLGLINKQKFFQGKKIVSRGN